MKLSEAKKGQPVKILRVGGSGALKRRLLDMGVTPGTQVLISKIAPLADPIQITVRGYELTLRREDAAKIQVSIARWLG